MGIYKVIKINLPKNIRLKKRRRRVHTRNKKYSKSKLVKYIAITVLVLMVFKIVTGKTEAEPTGNVIETIDTADSEPEKPIKEETKIPKGFFGKFILLKETIPFFNSSDKESGTKYSQDDEHLPQNNGLTEYEPITFSNLDKLKTFEDLKKYMYTIDDSAYVTEDNLNVKKLLHTNVGTDISGEEPTILIFHTHSQEDFINSEKGLAEDSIIGVGQTLGEILADKYGISVVHDVGKYDLKDGELNRTNSYETMEKSVKKILEKYPSIKVCIDLHRDGVEGDRKLVTHINGKDTAQIMFFNGICKINDKGKPKSADGLKNKYINENLAFSFHMQAMANTIYPDFARKIYIKPYRYSLHMKPLSLLIEVGANTNTVEEAKNAMEPLAEILVRVLSENNT